MRVKCRLVMEIVIFKALSYNRISPSRKLTQDKIELKPLIRLDLQPVLNDELLQLADYMKETTFALRLLVYRRFPCVTKGQL